MNSYTSASTGTFAWAMAQARGGRDVRRRGWPIEVENAGVLDRDYAAIWHVYRYGGSLSLFQGWNSGIFGADNERVSDFGTADHIYTPTENDLIATDWQLVSDVTPDQIMEMDANRVPHNSDLMPQDGDDDDLHHRRKDRLSNLFSAVEAENNLVRCWVLFSLSAILVLIWVGGRFFK